MSLPMIPPWINQTLGRDGLDQTKTLLEPRIVTVEIARAAWNVPSAISRKSLSARG